jgi:hypothetical protein
MAQRLVDSAVLGLVAILYPVAVFFLKQRKLLSK